MWGSKIFTIFFRSNFATLKLVARTALANARADRDDDVDEGTTPGCVAVIVISWR